MKLKLAAAISALAIPALAHAQQSGSQPKPTKADAQNVVQIITSDKVKTQACCHLAKLFDQIRDELGRCRCLFASNFRNREGLVVQFTKSERNL